MNVYDTDKLTKEIVRELTEKYPYLLPRNVFTDKISDDYDYSYVRGEYELPEGWFQLFLQMCEDIKEPLVKVDYLDKFRFSEIKEKYGSMRCYTFGATNEVNDIISKYEFLSKQVCCICGRPASIRTHGYICPFCSEHIMDSNESIEDVDLIDIKTSFIRRTYSNNKDIETIINCSDEWNRYLERINTRILI